MVTNSDRFDIIPSYSRFELTEKWLFSSPIHKKNEITKRIVSRSDLWYLMDSKRIGVIILSFKPLIF